MKMKNKKIFTMLLASTFIFAGCSNNQQKEKTNTESQTIMNENKEEVVQDNKEVSQEINYKFYIDKDGKAVKKEDIGDRIVLHWFTDPNCSGCVHVNTATFEHKAEYLGDDAVIEQNMVAFEGDYSKLASSYIVAVNTIDPELAPAYYDRIINEHFFKFMEISKDNAFKETYEQLGGTKWNEVEKIRPEAEKVVNANTEDFLNNPEYIEKSPFDYVFTPFVYSDENGKAIEFTSDKDLVETLREDIEKAISK